MPLIQSDPKGKKISLTIELDRKTNATLKKYVRFCRADTQKVVAGALQRLFEQDKEFVAWLEDRGHDGKKNASSPVAEPASSLTASDAR